MDDLQDGFEIWGDPDVMKFVGTGQALTIAQVKKSIQAGINHQEKYGYQHWAVIEKESKTLIGSCGFNSIDKTKEIELVFHFKKPYWGKGFASEAAVACVDFAALRIQPTKIVASCHLENESSKKVLLKAGLKFQGNKWFEDTQCEEAYFELITKDV